jgi:hypothetical protein
MYVFLFLFEERVHDKPKRITNHKKEIAPRIPRRRSGKTVVSFIEDLGKRRKTLSQRMSGLFKKVYETK